MTHGTDSGLKTRDLEDPNVATVELLKLAFPGADGRREALIAVREQPEAALAALATDRNEAGLTLHASARALEEILGEIPDPANARTLFEEGLVPERRVSLLVVTGDLESVAFQYAAMPDVFSAIIASMLEHDLSAPVDPAARHVPAAEHRFGQPDATADEDDDRLADGHMAIVTGDEDEGDDDPGLEDQGRGDRIDPAALIPWVRKLVGRPDYEELLDEAFCDRTFREWVLLALWVEVNEDSSALTPALFDEYGLEPREASEALARVLADEGGREFTLAILETERERFRDLMRAPAESAARERASALKDRVKF